MLKKFLILVSLFSISVGCSVKTTDVIKNKGIKINPEFSYAIESSSDRDIQGFKFPSQSKMLDTIISSGVGLSATESALFNPGVLGRGVDFIGAGASFGVTLLDAFFTVQLSPDKFVWMPIYRDEKIDFNKLVADIEKYTKEFYDSHLDEVAKLMKAEDESYNLVDVGIRDFGNVFSLHKTKTILVESFMASKNSIKYKDLKPSRAVMFQIVLHNDCNENPANYKGCITKAYLICMWGVLDNPYLLKEYIDFMSRKIEGVNFIFYYTNKAIKDGKAYNYFVKDEI